MWEVHVEDWVLGHLVLTVDGRNAFDAKENALKKLRDEYGIRRYVGVIKVCQEGR